MSPENTRDKIKLEKGKSIAEMSRSEKICPLWVKETVIDIWHPDKEKKELNFCLATHRMICLRDIKHFENCEYFLQYNKSDAENTPLGGTTARYPITLKPEDLY